MVLVRVDQRHPAALDLASTGGLAIGAVAEDDLRSVPANGRDLDRRRVSRHHHDTWDTSHGRSVSQGSPVVPGRMRDHAARRRRLVQAQHRVGRAARLERADLLQVLALEERLEPELLIEPPGVQDRRPVDVRCDAARRGADVFDRR